MLTVSNASVNTNVDIKPTPCAHAALSLVESLKSHILKLSLLSRWGLISGHGAILDSCYLFYTTIKTGITHSFSTGFYFGFIL